MIDDILKDDKDFEELLTKIARLTLKDETKEYLKSNLTIFYDDRKSAEQDIIKYSLKVILSLFIFLVLNSSTIDNISIEFLSIKDLSLIKIFFPIVILYYSLLMSSVDLFRIQNTILYYKVQAVLYPDIILSNLSDLFIPFSFINLISKSPSSNKLVRILTNLSYLILFGFLTFTGFFVFAYFLKFGWEKHLFKNILFIVSIFVQTSLILLTISIFIRKMRLNFLRRIRPI